MSTLLAIHLLSAVGFGLWLVLKPWLRPSQSLRITHWILLAVIALPLAVSFVPKPQFLKPTVQIWSAPSIHAHRVMSRTSAESISFAAENPSSGHSLSGF